MQRTRVIVDGVVQGVYFRDTTRRTAIALGVAGWVRNLSDGRVEAVFEGAPDAVEQALRWVEHGPERAIVTGTELFAETPEGLTGFEIRR